MQRVAVADASQPQQAQLTAYRYSSEAHELLRPPLPYPTQVDLQTLSYLILKRRIDEQHRKKRRGKIGKKKYKNGRPIIISWSGVFSFIRFLCLCFLSAFFSPCFFFVSFSPSLPLTPHLLRGIRGALRSVSGLGVGDPHLLSGSPHLLTS